MCCRESCGADRDTEFRKLNVRETGVGGEGAKERTIERENESERDIARERVRKIQEM